MKKLILILTSLLLTFPALANEKYSCEETKGKYCKNIKSCEEAKFYLKQCGLSRLDRDKDGVPCENVCRK